MAGRDWQPRRERGQECARVARGWWRSFGVANWGKTRELCLGQEWQILRSDSLARRRGWTGRRQRRAGYFDIEQPAACGGDAAMAGADADHINSLRIGRQMINHSRFKGCSPACTRHLCFYGNQTVTVLIIKEQLPDSGLMVGTNPVSELACLTIIREHQLARRAPRGIVFEIGAQTSVIGLSSSFLFC